ncbi:hypothetical protein [Pararhodobacter sp.]|nr:hypothetical protein [Pararhodobacter sp.]
MEQHRKDRLKWELRQAVRNVRNNWKLYLLLLASILITGGPFFPAFPLA